MANWCKTKYVIKGSVEDVNKLNSIFQKLENEKTNKSGDFDNRWLGFVVKELNGNENEIDCRGWFEDVKLKNKTTLKLTTWSAWCPCYELFEFITEKIPSLQYYFKCEEPACEVFATNDTEKKYFRYSNKYRIMNKDDILSCIELGKYWKPRFGSHKIPNDAIYI